MSRRGTLLLPGVPVAAGGSRPGGSGLQRPRGRGLLLHPPDPDIPFVSFGQRTAWDPGGVDRVSAVVLIVTGRLMAAAVVAGAHRTLNRS